MLTPEEFFKGAHLNSYICLLDRETKAQKQGIKIEQNTDVLSTLLAFLPNNQAGDGVHYTVNGIKDLEAKNRKTNIEIINGWLLEIDIDECKNIQDDEALLDLREERKARIRGVIFDLEVDFWPSLMVETRNGFQITWFALDGSLENFETIANGLWQKFKSIGADRSGMNAWSMFRVPNFFYNKNGEKGRISPFPWLSTNKLFAEKDILSWLAPNIEQYNQEVSQKKAIKNDLNLLLQKKVNLNHFGQTKEPLLTTILKTPISELLPKLSGLIELRGDSFSLSPINANKQQIKVNNQPSPNWIDLENNLLFSNNVKGMCNIIHFVEYYGLSKREVISLLSKFI